MIENLINRAAILIEQGKFDLAKPLVADALGQDPDHVQALTCMAICQAQLEGNEIALETIKRAIELDPEEPDVWRTFCMILMNANDKRKNLELRQALETWGKLSWREEDWYNQMARFEYMVGQKKKAKELLQEGLQKYPSSYNLLTTRGNLAIEQKDIEDAEAVLEIMGSKNPDDADYWFLKAKIQEFKGEMENAKSSYLESLRIYPDSSVVFDRFKYFLSKGNKVLHYLFHYENENRALGRAAIAVLALFVLSLLLPNDWVLTTGIFVIAIVCIRWILTRSNQGYREWSLALIKDAKPYLDAKVKLIGPFAIVGFFIWVLWMGSAVVQPANALIVIFSGAMFFELVFNFSFYFSFLPDQFNSASRWVYIGIQLIVVAIGIYFQTWWMLLVFYLLVTFNGILLGSDAIPGKKKKRKSYLFDKEEEATNFYENISTPDLLRDAQRLLNEENYGDAKAMFIIVLERDQNNEIAKQGLTDTVLAEDEDLASLLFFPIWKLKFNFWVVVRTLILVSNVYISVPLLAIYFAFAWYFSAMFCAFSLVDKAYKFLLPKYKQIQAKFFWIGNLAMLAFWPLSYFSTWDLLSPYFWFTVSLFILGLLILEAPSLLGKIGVAIVGGLLFLTGMAIYPEVEYAWAILIIFGVFVGVLFSFRIIGGKRKEFVLVSSADNEQALIVD